MQATDNYSDFVEERSAGVIVVLAEQGKGRERRTALSLSHAAELLTNTPTCAPTVSRTHTHTHTSKYIILAKAQGQTHTGKNRYTHRKIIIKHWLS